MQGPSSRPGCSTATTAVRASRLASEVFAVASLPWLMPATTAGTER